MSDTVIQVENLGKKYIIGHQKTGRSRYVSLRDVLADGARSLADRIRHPRKAIRSSEEEEFWALKDVSFEVKQGEVLGIIGRNGAGKSTLLKLLSRITEPTTGQIRVRGRVASLLEVGTGFHPELTGRENIFLNGSILGMGKTEIRRKFDEIVEFAEVERFLDTPVKRYSSGMYVRLAFAVAAHLEPEILVVDEVLAVGDAAFQKKCMGKMNDASRMEGRTVFFVSHNMGAIQTLCSRALLLSHGQIVKDGNTTSVINHYKEFHDFKTTKKTFTSRCKRFQLKLPFWIDREGNTVNTYVFGENPCLRFEFYFSETVPRINPGIAILRADGERIFTSHLLDDEDFPLGETFYGNKAIHTKLNLVSLAPGLYEVIFGVRDEHENTVIYSEGDVWLEIGESSRDKNGCNGILWHTTDWLLAD